MKLDKLNTIFVSILFVFTILMTSTFILLSKELNIARIESIAKSEISKIFPHANIKLENISYSIRPSIQVKAKKLRISYEKESLLEVKDLEMHIPILSILFGGGVVDVLLKGPELTYYETKNSNNWNLAMGTNTSRLEKAKVRDTLPSFLLSSTLNLKFSDMKLNYFLKSGKNGGVNISSVFINNVGVHSKTAFEIKSSLNFNKPNESPFSFNFLLIGELHVEDFFLNGVGDIEAYLKLDQLNIGEYNIPMIQSHLKLTLNHKNIINGEIETEFDRNIINLNYSLNKKNISLSNIKINLFLDELIKYKINSNLNEKDSKTEIVVSGSMNIGENKITPNLSFGISPYLDYEIAENSFRYTLDGSLREEKFNVKIVGMGFDGTINNIVQGKFLYNSKNLNFKDHFQDVNIEVVGRGLNFTSSFFHKIIYENSHSSFKLFVNEYLDDIPFFESTLLVEDSKVDAEDFTFKTNISYDRSSFNLKNTNLKIGKSKTTLSLISKKRKKNIITNFDLNGNSLDLEIFKAFLPKRFSLLEGLCNLKVKNSYSKKLNALLYRTPISLKCRKGGLYGLGLGEYLSKVYSTVSKVTKFNISDKIIKKKLNGEFDNFEINGVLGNGDYLVRNVLFQAPEELLVISGVGKLYDSTTQQSHLKLFLKDKLGISTKLKKSFNRHILPLMLSGEGLNLEPNFTYTLKKLLEKN